MTDLTHYGRFTQDQLAAMQKVYYSGKANTWQTAKYEFVCDQLLIELRQFHAEAKPASACYLHAAISACLQAQRDEAKREQAQMRAAAQNATTQLKAWRWEGLK